MRSDYYTLDYCSMSDGNIVWILGLEIDECLCIILFDV